MPGSLLSISTTSICPHAGKISIISTNARVLLGGQPAATAADTYLVAGCPFMAGPAKPQPCVLVKWLVPASRVKIGGKAAVLQTSSGICQSAEKIPQGPPNIIATQVRVRGI